MQLAQPTPDEDEPTKHVLPADRAPTVLNRLGGPVVPVPQGPAGRRPPDHPGLVAADPGRDPRPATPRPDVPVAMSQLSEVREVREHRPPRPGIFAPNDRIASRYRIERFIAKGGMGEVYAAEDIELRGMIALKVLAARHAGDSKLVARLKREILLARRITHPNVCRLFDLGFHHASSSEPEMVFLTMELLHGETLASRLRRQGRIHFSEVPSLLEQMCAGLGAAHEAGVVHRDFKTGNVLLVPTPEVTGTDRVVIIDFGLARGEEGGDPFSGAATAFGAVAGTPWYMAPEQIEGRRAEATADVYALGVVLFEMITGQLPFAGDTPLEAAKRRLREPPPKPTSLVPSLSPQWEDAILRCLERHPEARFQNVAELARELRDVPLRTAPEPPFRHRRRDIEESEEIDDDDDDLDDDLRSRWLRPALILGAVVALLAAIGLYRSNRGSTATTPEAVPRPAAALEVPASEPGRRAAAAVLTLAPREDAPERLALATALGELVRAQLSVDGKLRLAGADLTARAAHELGIDGGNPSPTGLERLRRRLAVDHIVLVAAAENERLRARVRLMMRGQGPTTFDATGDAEALPALAAALGGKVRGTLGLPPLEGDAARWAAAAVPSAAEPVRRYGEGLVRHRRFDDLGAHDAWQRAATLAPNDPWVHAALASASDALGQRAEARLQARKAVTLAGALAPAERQLMAARADELEQKLDTALATRRALADGAPDDVALGVALANVQRAKGDISAAYATLDRLRRLPKPLADDPAIDLADARAAIAAADWSRARETASSAAARALALGANTEAGAARRLESAALLRLGETKRALASADEAVGLAGRVGDSVEQTDALLSLGMAQAQQGTLARAQDTLEHALELARAAGTRARQARALEDLAALAERRDRLERAADLLLQSAALAGAPDDGGAGVSALRHAALLLERAGKLGESDGVLAAVANVARRRGDLRGQAEAGLQRAGLRLLQARLDEALRMALDSAALFRERDGAASPAALELVARIRLQQADLEGARRALDECLTEAPLASAPGPRALCLRTMTDLLSRAGDPNGARQRANELAAARVRAGEGELAPDPQLTMAAVLVDTGEAERAVQAVTGSFSRADDEAQAALTLARARLAERRPREAQAALARARAALPGDEHVLSGLQLSLVDAEVTAALGDAAGARQRLAMVLAEARRRKLLYLELEAELTDATVALVVDGLAARPRLVALQRRARESGCWRLARLAGIALTTAARAKPVR